MTPGEVAHSGWATSIISTDPPGSVMDWEHIGPAAQAHWEAAAQAVQSIPPTAPSGPVNASYLWGSGNPPPGPGEFRTDTGNFVGATLLTFWPMDNNGQDLLSVLSALDVGDTISAAQASNSNNSRQWALTGPGVQNSDTTWVIPVGSSTSSGNQPSNGQLCNVVFTFS